MSSPVRSNDVGCFWIHANPGPSPVIRTRRYEYLESTSRAQLLMNLARVLDGPEFRTQYRMNLAGRPECVLKDRLPAGGIRGRRARRHGARRRGGLPGDVG